jgi:alpha-D-xyloside xylohydrolase
MPLRRFICFQETRVSVTGPQEISPQDIRFYDLIGRHDPRTRIWCVGRPTAAAVHDGDVLLTAPLQAQKPGDFWADDSVPARECQVRVRAYGPATLRLSVAFDGSQAGDQSPMLELDPSMARVPLSVRAVKCGWEIVDAAGVVRMRVSTADAACRSWGNEGYTGYPKYFDAELLPDGQVAVPLAAYDQFNGPRRDALPLAFIERDGAAVAAAFAFCAEPNEHFVGTGERFARLDLAGRTLRLVNTDGIGCNNRRTYKNVPFYASSRPYGLFAHTHSYTWLSLADISTRSAQGLVEEPVIDLFIIGGGSLRGVLANYQGLTGKPSLPPTWSYGVWMSRMTYFSADEVRQIAGRLREGGFPCDVLHLDTGWFRKNWCCEWRFSDERFPDPPAFMREMKDKGFRITLWQTPYIGQGNDLLETATREGYIGVAAGGSVTGSDLSAQRIGGHIDFSNPAAVRWYQGMLENLLRMGVAGIKTDFGEDIAMDGRYTMPARKLHNIYGLLYQRAAFEVTRFVTGEGIVWARAGWAGCQRYPLHWGGDSACTWDGMAASLRGGLQIGLSGFAFWSHDVPGFHGIPDFMASWPADDLYVRWTQFGVFTSHMRYHGTTPREPYEYPKVAPTVRKWLRLRYCLIPYMLDQARRCVQNGLPMLRAMVVHHEDDPTCWHIDDQYYFGDDFLVAPVMNSAGRRDVYLPEGKWVDFWTGRVLKGGRWLRNIRVPLSRMPLYVRQGAAVRVYPQLVACTDDMDMSRAVTLTFDAGYKGVRNSVLAATELK